MYTGMRTKRPRGTSGDAWELLNDCAICQAMKEGKASTKSELLEAFAKAKREQKGIVGMSKDAITKRRRA